MMKDNTHELFPRLTGSTQRTKMLVNDIDLAKVRIGRRWRAKITDQNSGKRYLVRGAACSLPDAVIISELK
jgi:hypothetical protein